MADAVDLLQWLQDQRLFERLLARNSLPAQVAMTYTLFVQVGLY